MDFHQKDGQLQGSVGNVLVACTQVTQCLHLPHIHVTFFKCHWIFELHPSVYCDFGHSHLLLISGNLWQTCTPRDDIYHLLTAF